MRTTKCVHQKSRTQLKRLQEFFCGKFNINMVQHQCITAMYDLGEVGNVYSAYQASLKEPQQEAGTGFVRRYFESDKTTCCGRVLKVRFVVATCHERDDCYEAGHVVKTCRECSKRYYLDKTVGPSSYEERACVWHIFYPRTGGELPAYISSKSGKTIISTDLLTDWAMLQCVTRCALPMGGANDFGYTCLSVKGIDADTSHYNVIYLKTRPHTSSNINT